MAKQIKMSAVELRVVELEKKVNEAKLLLANIAMDGNGYEEWSPKLKDAVKKFILNGYSKS